MAGTNNNFNHGFSDEKPIDKILISYTGININDEYLYTVLFSLAIEYNNKYSNLQPTYAAYSAHHLSVKFSYLLKRVFEWYKLDPEQTKEASSYFWDFARSLERRRSEGEEKLFIDRQDKVRKKSNSGKINNPVVAVKEPVVDKSEVTLFDWQQNNVYMNSYAYFEKENLVIDHWKLTDHYEDELFITIKENSLSYLYDQLRTPHGNKSSLLDKIAEQFSGEKGFQKAKIFLAEHGIPHEQIGRHDEKK